MDLVAAATQLYVFKRGRTVDKLDIFDFIRFKSSNFRTNLEDIILQDSLLIGLFFGWLSRISPQLLFNFVVRREFEDIVQRSSSIILDSYYNFSRFRFIFG